jgi:hypothetical protein
MAQIRTQRKSEWLIPSIPKSFNILQIGDQNGPQSAWSADPAASPTLVREL